MSLKTLLYFLSVVFLRPDSLCAQQLHIDYTRNPVEVTEAHLEIPFTAGSDYASNIPLSTAAIVRVEDLSEFEPWCLQAYLLGQSANTPSITLSADLESVNLSQAALDGTPVITAAGVLCKTCFFRNRQCKSTVRSTQYSRGTGVATCWRNALHHTMGIGFWRLLGSIKNPALGRVLRCIQR